METTLKKNDFRNDLLDISRAGALPLDRTAHFLHLETEDFPNPKQEIWKYTNLHKVFPEGVNLATPDTKFENQQDFDLVLHNGGLVQNNRMDAFSVSLLSGMSGEKREKVVGMMKRLASFHPTYFFHLNSSSAQDAVIIQPVKSTEKTLIRILHYSDGDNTICFPRILFNIPVDSNIEAIIEFRSSHSNNVVVPVIQAEVAKGSVFTLNKLQIESEQTIHAAEDVAFIDENSTFRLHTTTLGGKSVRNTVYTALPEKMAHCELSGLYLPDGTQQVDNRTVMDHISPHCTSDELYKGVMAGKSIASFNGKVFVRQEAQKTNAFQSNQNILMSDDSIVNSKPELEIYADDVKCSHGSTTGQFDEEALFYLRSRGIGEVHARKLLVSAFAEEVISKIRNEEYRQRVESLLNEKMATIL